MSTSLTGITSESRTYSGTVVSQTELLSIAGLVGTPAPGIMYHMIEESEQQSLLGISYDTKSFVLIGESAPQGRDFAQEVSNLKQLIEEHDLAQSRLMEAAAAIASLERKAIALIERFKKAESRDRKPASGVGGPGEVELDKFLSTIRGEIAARQAEASLVRIRIDQLSREIRAASAHPGIIVARWRNNELGRMSVSAVPFGSASAASNTEVEGYVILGGVRIVIPFFSMDAATSLLDIEEASPGSLKSLKLAGVSTYLLQAKEIAYTSSSSLRKYLRLRASLRSAQLSDWASAISEFQQVGLDAAYSSSQQNVTGGRIGKFQWRRVDVNFSDRWNKLQGPWNAHEALDRRRQTQSDLLAIAGATSGPEHAADGEWMTVIGQVMSFSNFTRVMLDTYAWWTGVLRRPGDVTKLEDKLTGRRPPALVRELMLEEERRKQSSPGGIAPAGEMPLTPLDSEPAKSDGSRNQEGSHVQQR
ncbi:MAG: hypothetical protein IT436_07675 [Phycisphaerales bacterium]|nr:hypothetical protein [Phycisphaerales bacterium]